MGDSIMAGQLTALWLSPNQLRLVEGRGSGAGGGATPYTACGTGQGRCCGLCFMSITVAEPFLHACLFNDHFFSSFFAGANAETLPAAAITSYRADRLKSVDRASGQALPWVAGVCRSTVALVNYGAHASGVERCGCRVTQGDTQRTA